MKKKDCYCINLRRITSNITNLYDKSLKSENITINQFSLIKSLSELKSSTITDLAEYMDLDRTTLTRSLKPLIENQLIVDRSKDKRVKDLQLTQLGHEKLAKTLPIWNSLQKDMENLIGKDEIKLIINTLEKI